MALLKWFESIRTPFLNGFFSGITYLGEGEVLFALIGLTLYWCYAKRTGLYVVATFLLSTITGQWLKILRRVPRPWVADPSFTIVESARAGAGGYSFPSGHSSAAVNLYGALAIILKKRVVTVVCVVISLLVLVSRMYLGVHFPSDVLVGGLLGLIALLLLQPLMLGPRATEKTVKGSLLAVTLVGAGFAVYLSAAKLPADVDAENLAHALKNCWTLLGAAGGAFLGYCLEESKVRFSEKAPLHVQLLKVIPGLLLVLLIRSALKPVMGSIFGDNQAGNALRYGLMTFFATGVWPMTFPFLSRIGAKK